MPQFSSRQRSQDHQAWLSVRGFMDSQSEWFRRHGRYSSDWTEIGWSEAREITFNHGVGCAEGYCYQAVVEDSKYSIRAWPMEWGKSGYRSFFGDQTGMMRYTTEHRLANSHDESAR
jgi:hypothetical protein